MDHKGQFTKIEKSEKPMYGRRGLLVCGYPEEERSIFLNLLDKAELAGISVVFTSSHDLETSVGDLLCPEDEEGTEDISKIPRAVIMSGLTQNELHGLMAVYREAGLPRQIWATLTPVSEKWTLKQLLTELQKEERTMANKRK